jgi:effector-binding domain-containing protein
MAVPSHISIVDASPRPLAVVRVTTVLSTWPSQFMHSLNKVYDAVKAGHVRQSGQNVMIYRPRDNRLVDIECGVEIEAKFEPIGEVVYSETPSGPAVTATHIGPYEQLRISHDAVVEWSHQNGYRLAGTCWEIYGDWNEDPAKLRTDIFQLVRR